jgi:hypothetical protein
VRFINGETHGMYLFYRERVGYAFANRVGDDFSEPFVITFDDGFAQLFRLFFSKQRLNTACLGLFHNHFLRLFFRELFCFVCCHFILKLHNNPLEEHRRYWFR